MSTDGDPLLEANPVTPTNLTILTDGSNADALHVHASAGISNLDHGTDMAAASLLDDDHPQYVKKAGDTMTGELIIDPVAGTTALDCQKDITLKSGQKLIYDGS